MSAVMITRGKAIDRKMDDTRMGKPVTNIFLSSIFLSLSPACDSGVDGDGGAVMAI